MLKYPFGRDATTSLLRPSRPRPSPSGASGLRRRGMRRGCMKDSLFRPLHRQSAIRTLEIEVFHVIAPSKQNPRFESGRAGPGEGAEAAVGRCFQGKEGGEDEGREHVQRLVTGVGRLFGLGREDESGGRVTGCRMGKKRRWLFWG
jgi:hypothetical protein